VPARTMTTKKERDSSFRVELSYSTVIQKTLHTSQRPHSNTKTIYIYIYIYIYIEKTRLKSTQTDFKE